MFWSQYCSSVVSELEDESNAYRSQIFQSLKIRFTERLSRMSMQPIPPLLAIRCFRKMRSSGIRKVAVSGQSAIVK